MDKAMTRTQMRSALDRLIWDTDLVGTRLILAIAEAFWALLLWWPGDTFERHTYMLMAAMLPEDVWGLVFAVTAILQVSILFRNEFHDRFARWFAAWNAALWLVTTSAVMMSLYPPGAGLSGDIALTCAAWWVWARPYLMSTALRELGYDHK